MKTQIPVDRMGFLQLRQIISDDVLYLDMIHAHNKAMEAYEARRLAPDITQEPDMWQIQTYWTNRRDSARRLIDFDMIPVTSPLGIGDMLYRMGIPPMGIHDTPIQYEEYKRWLMM